jgi:hypothetical protein
MKIRLSKGMNKCIEEAKKYAEENYKLVSTTHILHWKTKPTKKKTFDFQVLNFGKPALKIFINGKLYKSLIKFGNEWEEV